MSLTGNRYTDEFKKQIVGLIEQGKSPKSISEEYQLARSTVNKWYSDYKKSGSFKAKDNVDPRDVELKKLKKELAYAKMEVDILKQAALIMGRKKR